MIHSSVLQFSNFFNICASDLQICARHWRFFVVVIQSLSHVWLCDCMDYSMPGSSVLEFAQIHIHWVGDAIQPPHPLLPPSSFAFNPSQHWEFFPVNWPSASGSQSIGASVSATVLSMNIQLISFRIAWFDLLAVQGTLIREWPRAHFHRVCILAVML